MNTLKLPENYQRLLATAKLSGHPELFTDLVRAFDSGDRKAVKRALSGQEPQLVVRLVLLALNEGLLSCDEALELT